MKKGLLIFIVLIGLFSCEKGPGEGGTSVIEGQVYKIFTFQNPNTGLLDTSYYQLDSGKDVFIEFLSCIFQFPPNVNAAIHDIIKTLWSFI